MMTDIHTHSPRFKAGQNTVLSVQLHADTNVDSLMNEVSPELFLSAGMHPWHAPEWANANIPILETLLQSSRIALIGEIGLDNCCGTPLGTQLQVFEIQLEIAEKVGKPVLIHNVGHQAELFALKKKHGRVPAWIVHGFRGKAQAVEQYLKNGFYLSFGKHYQLQALLACPMDRLLLETDESTTDLSELYKEVAIKRGISIDELETGIDTNFHAILGH